MREKMLCVVLAGLLAVSLPACSSGGEGPSAAPTLSQPVETVMPSAEPSPSAETALPSEEPSLPMEPSNPTFETPEVEFSLPEREYEPWQTAYMDFLAKLCQIEMGLPWDYMVDDVDGIYEGLAEDGRGETIGGSFISTMAMGSDTYSLYDVDRDGVPELFVAYGFASDFTQCYTFRDGQIVCIGEFGTKDSALYGHPEKSAVLCHWGRMGGAALYEYDMVDGVLAEGQVLFSEGWVDEYTATDEIVPGAQPIDEYYTFCGEYDWNKFLAPESEGAGWHPGAPSDGKALLLPICDWYDGPAATGDSSEQARTAILAVLNGEQPLYGASGDHYYGDVGWTTWDEYIQPGAACSYNERPLEIARYVWLDMNGDGQEECVVWLEAGRDDEEWSDQGLAVLSEQRGTVYAYYFGFYESAELGADGVFYHIWGDYNRALSFWQDQCYEYDIQQDAAANPMEWVDGSPTG